MEKQILSVGQINEYLKLKLDADPRLSNVAIRGELSNYKIYPSGHHYFTLKDETGAMKCVMFKSSALRLRFRPENGMKVIAMGSVTVYVRDGAYQLYCTGLVLDGIGDLYAAFEQLKERLGQEGLFDPAHKKPLPKYPATIGIITSSAGAAVHDMLRILRKRYPLTKVLLLPVRVQGVEAPGEIAAAIGYANHWNLADLLIVGRGGGSIEDLWAFNDERVARAIFASRIPVISAVGHEPDVTIADFVADLRAATPSNAAELAVPDQNELYEILQGQRIRLEQSMTWRLAQQRRRLEQLAQRRPMTDPTYYFQTKRQNLDHQSDRLIHAMEKTIAQQRQRTARLAAALDAMSPLKVLGRGYAIARKEDGTLLTRVGDACPGEKIELRVSDGSIPCRVDEK